MRILDNDSDKSLQNIIVYLTKDEAKELKDDLERMLEKLGSNNEHAHIDDRECVHELTAAIYDPNKLSQFDERSKKIILEDK